MAPLRPRASRFPERGRTFAPMRKLSASLLALAFAAPVFAKEAPALKGPPLSPPAAVPADTLVPFASPESISRLEHSQAKVDFFHLANHYEGQTNKAFCGPTSATVVLNALRADNEKIEKPEDPSLFPAEVKGIPLPKGMDPLFHRYTQNNFFEKGSAVKTKEEVFGKPKTEGGKRDGGIQLRQLAAMLSAHGLDVQLRIADEKLTDAQIRAELVKNLQTENDYVIINYHRPTLGQRGGGHISPVAAYDAKSDSFLILDVNPNGQTWVWAQGDALLKSLRTKDVEENRGYLLVKEGPAPTAEQTPR